MVDPCQILIKAFDLSLPIYAVFFPLAHVKIAMSFWMITGLGVSTRVAEAAVQKARTITEIPHWEHSLPESAPVFDQITQRISNLIERASISPQRSKKVSPNDIYLYQTGMTAIWSLHQLLSKSRNATTVIMGFMFHVTIVLFEEYGPPSKVFGPGTDDDMNELEAFLASEKSTGRAVQAVWTEFPNNPLAVTPDLVRLRSLADEYGFILIVDDTIGGFCNVDVMDIADVLITSLTKSFSGYADVMAGSLVLNPSSVVYKELKQLMNSHYRNDLFIEDAIVLEQNSCDYLERSTILNKNASALVGFLQAKSEDPTSCVKAVNYPSICWSRPRYERWMRPATDDFTPGYGCLLSVDFDIIESTIAFYDNFDVHNCPHLGAHVTLALPYVKGLYADKLEWVGRFDMKETMIRIAPGLEQTEGLLDRLRFAVAAADGEKTRQRD